MAESMTVMWSWQLAGQVALSDGKLMFPSVPNVAGVYRLVFSDAMGARKWVYVGEGDPLRRRFQHYRTPGSSEHPQAGSTNLRLNRIMVDILKEGGRVSVEIATRAEATAADGVSVPLDLEWKSARVLVERAAEVGERTAGLPLLNL